MVLEKLVIAESRAGSPGQPMGASRTVRSGIHPSVSAILDRVALCERPSASEGAATRVCVAGERRASR